MISQTLYAQQWHKVQPGQTVGGISKFFGIPDSALIAANPQLKENPDLVLVGEWLQIPMAVPFKEEVAELSAGVTITEARVLTTTLMPVSRVYQTDTRKEFFSGSPKTDTVLVDNDWYNTIKTKARWDEYTWYVVTATAVIAWAVSSAELMGLK